MSEIPLQQRVQPWLMECFGPMIAGDREERNHRFLEEALELIQACGATASEAHQLVDYVYGRPVGEKAQEVGGVMIQACGATASEAHQLVDYVYGRPVGEKAQEVGGVMITLAALCLANDLDMHQAGEVELARIWTKVEQIRAKQAAKPKHSPLPAAAPVAAQQWTDEQIVALLASLGIDADKSKYGFPELQVATTVPGICQIIERAQLAAPVAPTYAGLLKDIGEFPELNMNNYTEDQVRELNYWGVRVALAAQEIAEQSNSRHIAVKQPAQLAAPADLLRRLLADHQRVEPHHPDQCQLCREATAAIEGQSAPEVNSPQSLDAAQGSMEDFAEAADLVSKVANAETNGAGLFLILDYRQKVRMHALAAPAPSEMLAMPSAQGEQFPPVHVWSHWEKSAQGQRQPDGPVTNYGTKAAAGCKLVPTEATDAMMQAAWDMSNAIHGTPEADDPLPRHLYRAMVDAAPAQPETWKVLPSPARVTGEMLHQAFPEIPGETWPLPAARQAVWERFAERVNARLAGELKQEAKE